LVTSGSFTAPRRSTIPADERGRDARRDSQWMQEARAVERDTLTQRQLETLIAQARRERAQFIAVLLRRSAAGMKRLFVAGLSWAERPPRGSDTNVSARGPALQRTSASEHAQAG
jgi:hypothetical protein